MINAIEWFKQKGFTFDDKITIKDVLELQDNAKEDGIEMADDLYQSAITLIRNPKNRVCWENLQNSANRWDALRQSARNDAIMNLRGSSEPCCDICSGTHHTDDCLK